MPTALPHCLFVPALLLAAPTYGQLVPTLAPTTATEEPPGGGVVLSGSRATLVIGGYAEVFYQWNFNQPAGGITNYRGFDDRHNSVTVSNAVLDVTGSVGPVSTHIALQVGHTPQSYYLAEPVSPGAAGAGSSNGDVWKYIQQAVVSYRTPLGRGLTIDGGIYLSPIGPESLQIKDQWNWSRSNLFFGPPYYHTGFRISYPFTDRLTLTLHANNGWNNVVDNNVPWSLACQLAYAIPDRLLVNFVYFAGVERSTGAPEGQPWRHLFDAYLVWTTRERVDVALHGDGGFEQNSFGTSFWGGGAAYLRVRPHRILYLAARVDVVYQETAETADGAAASIFWPASVLTSQTSTIDLRPHDHISFRLEYRHDHASDPLFFSNAATRDTAGLLIPDDTDQDTLTIGMVAWF